MALLVPGWQQGVTKHVHGTGRLSADRLPRELHLTAHDPQQSRLTRRLKPLPAGARLLTCTAAIGAEHQHRQARASGRIEDHFAF